MRPGFFITRTAPFFCRLAQSLCQFSPVGAPQPKRMVKKPQYFQRFSASRWLALPQL